ncbi:hypothetical protein [Thalassospira sp. ER-Se-21-Dark]|uniref:hypothetical protein n=1 Tax=Thalassospira sp. ER-Se-21-Dark TaxID=2585190 RepID=UPI001B31543B|nr:hypothetical protein [Thalassospira sp. ER-Se-21-Dark]MBP3124834.1 hypothetical protein [Thalassospira sp. ER-Se-21-Dark]
MTPRTGAVSKIVRTSIFIAVSLVVSTLAAIGNSPANATETIDIRFPVRESEFDTVFSCQNDNNPDCRSCLADRPDSASLVMYSILQEALNAGGLAARVQVVPSPNSERSRMMVSEGFADIKSDWDFNIDADPKVLKSRPIVRRGEFEKGIYVRPDKLTLARNTPISNIHHLSAVSLRTWRLDWEVLERLEPASLSSAATKQQIYSLIDAGRADFTLLEFSSAPEMVRSSDGIRLYPMPGVKVVLPASQHFMISRALPNVEKIVKALNSGIDALHASGFIHQCLVNSGIINEQVRDWRILNPTEDQVAHQKTVPSN